MMDSFSSDENEGVINKLQNFEIPFSKNSIIEYSGWGHCYRHFIQ